MRRLIGVLFLTAAMVNPLSSGEHDPITFYVQFVRGSNEAKPEDANWKPIGRILSKHLIPIFRWKNYWEVSRYELPVTRGKVSKLHYEVRDLEIELVDEKHVEFRLYRKGVLTRKSRQSINGQGMEILGGNRDDDNAWFVVIRRDKPTL